MEEKPSIFSQRALETVKWMWKTYITTRSLEELNAAMAYFSEDLIMVGTGRHEFYQCRNAFLRGLTQDRSEAQEISFEIVDEWYEVQEITADVCLVYGTLWIREMPARYKEVFVDMDGRFTVLCRDGKDKIEICSLHHSIPYTEQREGEYYPKTLTAIAEEALEKSRQLEQRVELDSLTELYNRVHMEKHVRTALNREDGVFFMLDLDNFKRMNDTVGHLTGDGAIRDFAGLLRRVFGKHSLIGRMGGDEFAVWLGSPAAKKEAESAAAHLLDCCNEIAEKYQTSFSCSIGMAYAIKGQLDFDSLYRRADQALYLAKRKQKGTARWYKDE